MVKENSKISETLKKSLEESGKESGNIFKTMTYTQKSKILARRNKLSLKIL